MGEGGERIRDAGGLKRATFATMDSRWSEILDKRIEIIDQKNINKNKYL